MNICFINFNKRWGGVKTWTIDYGSQLVKRGHKVVAVVRPDTPFVQKCIDAGFETHVMRPGMKYNPVTIAKIFSILKSRKVDAAVVNISKDVNIGAVACKLAGVPVYHRVGLPQDYKNTSEEKRLHGFIKGIIVPSQGLKEDISKLPWMRADIISVLFNSKDREKFKPKMPSDKIDITIGVSSQLSVTKGHIYLLDAARMLADDGVKFKLLIAGTGSNEAQLKEYVAIQELNEFVEFCGFQTDVPAFLQSLDVFALPSLEENFPNTLLEAMFTGLPCVAFNAGAVKELTGDACIILDKGDSKGLYDAIRLFAEHLDMRKKYGQAARKRCLDLFDIEKNTEKLEKILSGEVI
ncbi:glycosyltransferase family 4 protein [Seleniivibrio sp.]|uniref:glycosyltransferase family 4 protein n=1 Tax=Seleniivibrio sp. TaxID=2898801 RepID=UPI0025D3C69C|nr:glycosyltransferase family 4 protein [Seleniivibrio sp.]MCD8552779.1 glycosyltransferase family 4 protein [Seleniivibrio sp.]